MASKQDYGECVGKCPVCTINLWSSTNGKPVVWPCNIAGCPHEDPAKQNRRFPGLTYSPTGSGLGQIDF